jgi:NAD(P)H-hydrate epimerase
MYVGEWGLLDISLHAGYIDSVVTQDFYLTKECIASLFHPRKKFSHKGSYGHALLVAGAKGKMGAAVLATGAALRSGAGLVTTHIPGIGASILTSVNPEAMLSIDANEDYVTAPIHAATFSAAGAGPGLGTHADTQTALLNWIRAASTPLVVDADALNIISLHKEILHELPENSILTPHPKEWTRLAGEAKNSFERLQQVRQFTARYKVIVVLKGAHTAITHPSGETWFNTTGNPGMAKGGSGDVLTGLLTGLLAQRYMPAEAAQIGVYVHGLAGDLAKASLGEMGMTAGDIIQFLPYAFMQVISKQ